MPSVFICYRREDTAPYAGWLRQALVTALGRDRVFMDIDTIAPGADFEEVIQTTLDRVDAVLVLIGPKWTTVVDSSNLRRLDNPDDYIRLEVATGLKRRIRVIPILVGGATVPRRDQLPEDLQSLARRQAIELTETRWEYDTSRLVESLKQLDVEKAVPTLPSASPKPAPFPAVADVKSQPSDPPDLAPTVGAARMESAAALTPLPVSTDVTTNPPEFVDFPELASLFAPGQVRDDEAPVHEPEPEVVARTVPQHSEPQSYVNKEPSGASAEVSSGTLAAAPTFAHLIGADGDRVQWRMATAFVAALATSSLLRTALDSFYIADIFFRDIYPATTVAVITGLVALIAFKHLPAVGASVVAGIANAWCTATIIALIGSLDFIGSIYAGTNGVQTIAFFALASLSVNKFRSVVIGPAISGAVAGMIPWGATVLEGTFSSHFPSSDFAHRVQFPIVSAVQGLAVGVVFFLNMRSRAARESQADTR